MNIFSNEGVKIYSINSPSSKYDKTNDIIYLGKTKINILKDQKTKYIINSDKSKLLNNYKIIELNGNVKIKTISQDNDELYADNFFWNTKESNYKLLGNVRFENNSIFLSSNKAILNSNDIVEFFNPVKYIIKGKNTNRNYIIKSENALYDITTNSVIFGSKEKKVKSKFYY